MMFGEMREFLDPPMQGVKRESLGREQEKARKVRQDGEERAKCREGKDVAVLSV